MEDAPEDIEAEIKRLRKRQKLLQEQSDKAVKDALRHHEFLFTVMVRNTSYSGVTHYGCFDSFAKAQAAVEKTGTYKSGYSKPVHYFTEVGVKAFDKFKVDELRDLNKIPDVWRNYWSD